MPRKSADNTSPTAPKTKHTPISRRERTDWDAIERDYRAGVLTLRELGTKHGKDHAFIARKAKQAGWQRDLTQAVQQATKASLIREAVANAATEHQQSLTETVLAAAELNKQVILSHRKRLNTLLNDADNALQKLIQLSDGIADVREAATYVASLEAASRTAKNLIQLERQAYGLDDDNGGDNKPADVVDAVASLVREITQSPGAKLPISARTGEAGE